MLLDIKVDFKLISLLFIISLVSCFSLIYPFSTKILIDYVYPSRNEQVYILVSFFLLAFVLFRHFLNLVQDLFFLLFRQQLEKTKIYNYLDAILSSSSQSDFDVGAKISRITSFMSSFQYSFVEFVYFFCYSILVSIISCFIIASIDVTLLYIVLAFIILHVINYLYHVRVIDSFSSTVLDSQYKLNGVLLEITNLISQIKVYSLENRYINKSKNQLDAYFENNFKRDLVSLFQECIQDFFIFSSYTVITFYLYIGYNNDQFTPGDFILCFFVIQLCFEPIYRFAATTKQMSELRKMSSNLKPESESNSFVQRTDRVDDISINRLQYETPNGKQIIHPFTYDFKKGYIYVVQGPSGCGKSTFLRLLSGNITPTSGSISFSLGESALSTINCCYLPQKYTPFNASLLDNVSLFSSTPDQEKALESLSNSGLYDFESVYDGLNQELVPTELSGGEKMKLGMAAMFYHRSNVILLDEVFSNLDSGSSKSLLNRLDLIKKDSIVIIVSHDSFVNSYADVILDFSDCGVKIYNV